MRHYSMRLTRVAQIYKETRNLLIVQMLLGHTKMVNCKIPWR